MTEHKFINLMWKPDGKTMDEHAARLKADPRWQE